MSTFFKYLLQDVIESVLAYALFAITDRVKSLLTTMSKTDSESEQATYELVAAKTYQLYGLSGLKTLVTRGYLPDYVFAAYLIRDRFAGTYPQSTFIPDAQPNITKDVTDFTNDAANYSRLLTFFDANDCLELDKVQETLKTTTPYLDFLNPLK